MKTQITILLLFFYAGIAAQENEYYLQLRIDHSGELHKLTRLISIDDRRGDTVYAYATEAQKHKLENAGYAYNQLRHPGSRLKSARMAETAEGMTNWDRYPTYAVYEAMMQQFATDYPNLCRLDTAGETHKGRHILVLRITDHPNSKEDEPAFFYTSTMHGDETVGFVLMLRLIDYLLNNYGNDAEVTQLVNQMDIFINPNANPDGTYASGNNTVTGATRNNANGIDLNRNFPDPDNGRHPDGNAWQKETRAMMDFSKKHTFTLSANIHGGAEVANYPWDTWAHDHPDVEWWKAVSHVYADAARANAPAGYFTSVTASGVTNGYDWYSIYGGRQDFMTYFRHGRELTLEISDTKLPEGSKLPDYWQYNKRALLDYMQQSLYGIRGIVTNPAGEPLHAQIKVLEHDTALDSSMVFTHPDAGNYHRLLAPGTYSLKVSAKGYTADTLTNLKVQEGAALRADVQLKPLNRKLPQWYISTDSVVQQMEPGQQTSVSVRIKNTGEGKLTYQARKRETCKWLSLNHSTDTLHSGEGISLTLDIQPPETDTILQGYVDITNNANDKTETLFVKANVEARPRLAFMPRKIQAFSYHNSPQQSTREIRLWNKGSGTINLDADIKNSGENPWISLEAKPKTLNHDTVIYTLNLDPTAVDTGTHVATIQLYDSTNTINDSLAVQLEVRPRAGLLVQPEAITDTLEAGSTQTLSMRVKNTGNAEGHFQLTYASGADSSTLKFPGNGYKIAAGDSAEMDVMLIASRKDTTQTGYIAVKNLQTHKKVFIPVHLHTYALHELAYSPDTIVLQADLPDGVPQTHVSLTNAGSGQIRCKLQPNPHAAPWLNIERKTLLVAQKRDSVRISAVAAGLPPGTFSTTIGLATQDTLMNLPVEFNVFEAPELRMNTDTLHGTVKAEENLTKDIILNVKGRHTIAYTLDAMQFPEWFDATPLHGLAEPGIPDTLHISMRAGNRKPDIYTTTVALKSDKGPDLNLPVRMQVLPATAVNAFKTEQLQVYPNPFTTTFQVNIQEDFPFKRQLIMRNLQGRKILSRQVQTGTSIRINIPQDLPAGVYILQMITPDGIISRKCILQQ